ncbi:MAG: hypothetical protein LBJ01_05645 [Tannerella sp.]|nr:hypothetical protein [Tannerella sp.]
MYLNKLKIKIILLSSLAGVEGHLPEFIRIILFIRILHIELQKPVFAEKNRSNVLLMDFIHFNIRMISMFMCNYCLLIKYEIKSQLIGGEQSIK